MNLEFIIPQTNQIICNKKWRLSVETLSPGWVHFRPNGQIIKQSKFSWSFLTNQKHLRFVYSLYNIGFEIDAYRRIISDFPSSAQISGPKTPNYSIFGYFINFNLIIKNISSTGATSSKVATYRTWQKPWIVWMLVTKSLVPF